MQLFASRVDDSRLHRYPRRRNVLIFALKRKPDNNSYNRFPTNFAKQKLERGHHKTNSNSCVLRGAASRRLVRHAVDRSKLPPSTFMTLP
jgi:hypothetical protein